MNIDSRHSISIIIPLSNGANYISALFASLKKQTLQPQEIIERATSSLPVPGADAITAGLLHQRGRSLFFPQPDQQFS